MLAQLYRELPELLGKLTVERVIYKQTENKIYISFLSQVLVEEKAFLRMEYLIRSMYPGTRLAIRVASPALAQDFLENISKYKQVFIDFVTRANSASKTWIKDLDWEAQGERVILTFPDDFSLRFMQSWNISDKLNQAIWDIFRIRVPVELRVKGNQEARLQALREERERETALLREREAARLAAEKGAKKEKAPASGKPSGAPEESMKPIKGRSIGDPPVPIRELTNDTGLVTVQGDVIKAEQKELKGGEMLLVSFIVTDYTSSVQCKIFYRYRNRFRKKDDDGADTLPITQEERMAVKESADRIKPGIAVRVRGECMYDSFAREATITVRDVMPVPKEVRMDTAAEKRVELHMHTQMSMMDATASAEDLIKRAAQWGHPAVAITDHGVVQAFPAAFSTAAKNNIKLIPGVEIYLTDEAQIVAEPDDRGLDAPIVVLDFETTGLDTNREHVIEIGAVKLIAGNVVDSFGMLVNPGKPLKPKITEITGITDIMLRDMPTAETAIPKLMDFIGDCAVAAHNASFDISMLRTELKRMGRTFSAPQIDTLAFARKLYPQLKSHRLGAVCRALGVSLKDAHRAVNDAAATAQCLDRMMGAAKEKGAQKLYELNAVLQGGAMGESSHAILLAYTQKGMENLNRLVSESHLKYFRRIPHVPRNVLQQYREGLIVGSACEAGELFQAVLRDVPEDELSKIARFYDYLEIQPVGNNAFMVREERVEGEEALRNLNRKIVALGDKLGIPVVATGDVHFLEPQDAIFRAILQAGLDYKDCDQQPPLYFKTTQEMLEEFSYLGEAKCREVVLDNPRKIADKVEALRLFPKHPKGEETFQPYWEDAADTIQNMAWGTARKLYGDELPELIVKRLDKELGSIIGYGFATLYSIAQKLVSKSLSDGYLVGSRGSVGSSFVATMCGITEVNPLPPHYRCINCRKGFFDVNKERYKVGVDLPDRDCPDCGQKLIKDGYDIPFEVFLGFKGDKVPDIDLNFSGEYQPKAHAYVEELFGKGHVFRAGTISALAEKTAYGYASKYLEERGIQAGNAEKERLAAGCMGVKRTTGQHPGGMVVLPKEFEIYQFTAIQHPADDVGSDTITTHYDFSSMHDILVKLDILGHDDPTMIHFLEEMTGIPYKQIPLDDKNVMSLFTSPKALQVDPKELGCSTGTLGIPEFGTGFVRQMLEDTRPTTMEELIRLSGLSHGTDVWLGNAKDLITSQTATLSQCICTRDDIMNYLISKGVQSKMAFDTMESVRKGRGLKPEMEEAMNAAEVPAWFIDSCKKIKYMFPKGHAVAYVTMALRVGWYKVYHPLAYYAAYFTIRGDGFDGARMLLSPEVIKGHLENYRQQEQKLSEKEKDEITALELVLEMRMRGISFLPADLYKSDAKRFLMEDGQLRVPFISLGGLGEAAAEAIIRERSTAFLSVEDLKNRAHLSSAVIELLREHGCLHGMPETSQLTLFNFL